MTIPQECVLDTSVLQKANAPLKHKLREHSQFAARLRLLHNLVTGQLTLLVSKRLLQEYRTQIPEPRNDKIRALFELISSGSAPVLFNWKTPWSGGDRDKAHRCRFPKEDRHVLRTAVRPSGSVIITEEGRMLSADPCIYREFRVHIIEPW